MRVSTRRFVCSAALLLLLLAAGPAPADAFPAAPMLLLHRARRAAAPAPAFDARRDAQGEAEGEAEDEEEEVGVPGQRTEKQLQLPYYAYLPPQFAPPGAPAAAASALPPQYYGYSAYQEADDNEVLSRAEPGGGASLGGRKPAAYPDSPVYYIRMPPTPYVFVPGLGYVSQPPPPPPQFSPFINLPVDFVANGKPTSVYWRPAPPPPPQPSKPAPAPAPTRPATGEDSAVTQLDQGPYVFNGRPTDLFVLRNTYNSLYNDALQNIYP